jgi:phosphate-selective porin OprO and OprP
MSRHFMHFGATILLSSTLLSSPLFAQSRLSDESKLLERLDKLERRVESLEAENRSLKDQAGVSTDRLERVELRAAKAVQPNVAPTLGDTTGDFTFKVRGVLDADLALFNERQGDYAFSNGTAFRRARLGFEGTAFKEWPWRIEVDFAGNQVSLLDAYLQYTGIKPWTFTLGQHKAPFGLESNNSDSYNTFIERGMFTNAFGAVGAERRIGASSQYASGNWTAAVGLFGDGEALNRTNAGPGESWGLNGRVTWEPVNGPGHILHLGAASFWRASLKTPPAGTATVATVDSIRLTERPNVRVDGGNIIDSGVITNVRHVAYAGAEAAAVHGPFSLTGEYGRFTAIRSGGLPDLNFDGFYVYGSWFLTGETRSFRNGNFDRLKPYNNLGKTGWGAVELALRYDRLNADATSVRARAGNHADSLTTALNWYFNPNAKLMFNWVRFSGSNTPLDPVGTQTAGDAFLTRLHLDW